MTKPSDPPETVWNHPPPSNLRKMFHPQEQAQTPTQEFDESEWDDGSTNLNDSNSQLGTQKTNESSSGEDDRDEVKQIQRLAAKETTWIRRWRFLTTLVLLGTACAVTMTTYRFLQEEQSKNFEQAVRANNASICWTEVALVVPSFSLLTKKFLRLISTIFFSTKNILPQCVLPRLHSKRVFGRVCTGSVITSPHLRRQPMRPGVSSFLIFEIVSI